MHSFRVGAATALFAAGVSLDVVQRMGRWAAPSSAALYARTTAALFAEPADVLSRGSAAAPSAAAIAAAAALVGHGA